MTVSDEQVMKIALGEKTPIEALRDKFHYDAVKAKEEIIELKKLLPKDWLEFQVTENASGADLISCILSRIERIANL